MDLVIRAYDEGIAFRYYFPDNPTGVYYKITLENTHFTFPANTKAWYQQWAQAPIQYLPLENWPDECERPLTLKLENGLYACLTEAAMVDFVRTKFVVKKDKPNTVVTSLYESIDQVPYFSTPWRVIMVAEKAGDLIENNHLILNLNPPGKLSNTGFIKPGKIIREMTLTNEGAKACIDFAAAHKLQYILFDWKWYGPAFTFDSDARKVAIDLDLQGIIKYGEMKGVGVWLYVNQQALLKQDKEIFPIYKKWGVKGVKYGFVQVGSHRWTNWLHESIQRAADNELMVNIHDEFRTTGEQRTWPNIMTVEGIRGNEEMPDATHNTILPFTRGIAGAGDYTICYYTDRIKTTHGHQLALGVVNYSPLQTLFWYDLPSDYKGEKEIEFFEKLPTVWDDTKILAGEPGEFIVTARKNGESWYVGGITNTHAREIAVSLDFLPKKQKYTITIYSDDPASSSRTKVKVEEKKVKSSEVLKLRLVASGGVAIIISPEAQEDSKETARKNN
jgi:alpha-glucosidase